MGEDFSQEYTDSRSCLVLSCVDEMRPEKKGVYEIKTHLKAY